MLLPSPRTHCVAMFFEHVAGGDCEPASAAGNRRTSDPPLPLLLPEVATMQLVNSQKSSCAQAAWPWFLYLDSRCRERASQPFSLLKKSWRAVVQEPQLQMPEPPLLPTGFEDDPSMLEALKSSWSVDITALLSLGVPATMVSTSAALGRLRRRPSHPGSHQISTERRNQDPHYRLEAIAFTRSRHRNRQS